MKEEEAGSEADPEEGMELKEECGEGEGPYLSEVERAASESEDGYGPPSQRYTADSLASSPASSSQLYVPTSVRWRVQSCDLVLLLLPAQLLSCCFHFSLMMRTTQTWTIMLKERKKWERTQQKQKYKIIGV